MELLNQQIAALRRQIGALEDALDASETRDRESQTRISDLGKRLNVALAQRVQELSRFRSDFFGRLREILARTLRHRGGGRSFRAAGIGAVRRRPATRSTRTFRGELDKLADAILQLEQQIPPEINWVIRVDGHTDSRPLQPGARFSTNWELSAARAIAVVRYLVSRGISPQHLVAAGFGEFQPLEEGDSEEAMARNRRIELKLTER